MSLALVQVPLSDFNRIHAHLTSYMPAHRNMHLREAHQSKGRRVLRYLHALYAHCAGDEIEGMISGPNVFWHYRIKPARAQTQLQVLAHRSSPQDAARIQHRFLREILARMSQEQAGTRGFPSYSTGQFYLRRRRPGMQAAHPRCQDAISIGALDPLFVSQLHDWNFALLHP